MFESCGFLDNQGCAGEVCCRREVAAADSIRMFQVFDINRGFVDAGFIIQPCF